MSVFKTSKGTELPLLKLKGKEYLEVKYRLVWFREDHPDWGIETEFLSIANSAACARATIRDPQGRIIAMSHKSETAQGFPDFLEKAETGAIGRALALIGYGTQFCADELDEGQRLVDTPAERPGAGNTKPAQAMGPRPVPAPAKTPTSGAARCVVCSEPLVKHATKPVYFCKNWKDQSQGEHTRVTADQYENFLRQQQEFEQEGA